MIVGWRTSTVDADIKLDPEPAGAFEALRDLKEKLAVNVELAAPDQFIPPLRGWRERSVFIDRYGEVDVFHYDFYAQALSKIERGHDRDLADVRQMIDRGLVEPQELARLFAELEPDLLRYPAIDAAAFSRKVYEFLEDRDG